MQDKLEKQLFEKYPKIFKQKDSSPSETCMCWGIECGDGWFWLLDCLCNHLQFDIDRNGYPQLEAVQVKEKFGTLRFYVSGANEKQQAMISFAEFLSSSICERCGSNKNVTQTEGWIQTLCEECKRKYNELRRSL